MVTVAVTDLKNKPDQILDHAEYERLQCLQESHLANCGETLNPSVACLLSMAGMFNSSMPDTFEQVKALVTDFILQ